MVGRREAADIGPRGPFPLSDRPLPSPTPPSLPDWSGARFGMSLPRDLPKLRIAWTPVARGSLRGRIAVKSRLSPDAVPLESLLLSTLVYFLFVVMVAVPVLRK